jgi:hypothetical protein
MTAVNWLVNQPWPIFLPAFLGPLALLAGLLLLYIHHRRPDEPEPETVWHMHECGCLCANGRIHPCDGHRGQAARVLHQEAP